MFGSVEVPWGFWIPAVSQAACLFFLGSAAELSTSVIVSFVCSATVPFMAKACNKLWIYASWKSLPALWAHYLFCRSGFLAGKTNRAIRNIDKFLLCTLTPVLRLESPFEWAEMISTNETLPKEVCISLKVTVFGFFTALYYKRQLNRQDRIYSVPETGAIRSAKTLPFHSSPK